MTDKPKNTNRRQDSIGGCIEGCLSTIAQVAAVITLAVIILIALYLLYNIARNTGGIQPLF